MSTISSPQEAQNALCDGEFFQVGGQIINPTDIVRVDYNGGQNPIFYLEDGTTVQHDRFKEGDVGDYLAAALTVATRGQAQSEAINPLTFAWDFNNYTRRPKALGQVAYQEDLVGMGFLNGLFTIAYRDNASNTDSSGLKTIEVATKKDVTSLGSTVATLDLSQQGLSKSSYLMTEVVFSDNMKYMWVVFRDTYDKFELDTPGNVSSITNLKSGVSLPTSNGSGAALAVEENTFYIVNTFNDEIQKYSMGTPYDLQSGTQEQSVSPPNFAGDSIATGRDVDGNTVLLWTTDQDKVKAAKLDGADLTTYLADVSTSDQFNFARMDALIAGGEYIHGGYRDDMLQWGLDA